MAIDILRHTKSTDIMSDCKELAGIEAFVKYVQDPESGIPITPLFVYVVLLYSKDSFLNKKPIEDLGRRRAKAASLADLDAESTSVQSEVFELASDKVVDLILGYLIHQNYPTWVERCVIESQMHESQRIRIKSVNESKDTDLMRAFERKAILTRHYEEWHNILKKYDAEIFADHEQLQAHAQRKRMTIESIAT